MAAWGVLTDEQKKDTSDKFVKLLEDSDQLALSRYAAIKETTKSDNEQLKADIAAAVSAAVSKIAAAASIPQKVEVSVAIPGIASVSEVVAY
jgi:thiamine monophosphate kinase